MALVDAFLAAYNAGDAEGIASLWRPDSVLYDTNFWVAPVGLVNPKRLTNERGDVERVSRVNQTGEFGGSSSVLVMFTVKVGGGHRSTWIPGMVHDAGQDPEHGDPLS